MTYGNQFPRDEKKVSVSGISGENNRLEVDADVSGVRCIWLIDPGAPVSIIIGIMANIAPGE